MKKFLIIGNPNNVCHKVGFPLIKDNKMWLGYKYGNTTFINSDKVVKICWYTNLTVSKRNELLNLTKHYNPVDYPNYDNYDAINVDRTQDIPRDYYGNMGVPVSFMDKYNPNQFEIIDAIGRYSALGKTAESDGKYLTDVNGIHKYARIIIKRK